uniref:Nucleoside diphosphate kinase A n=1 Tax=Rhinopithecus bieti TaxID=61621 RepID=A0A2K6LN45_RHIBE
MANCEHTFIAIKPDGVQWGLVGEIIKRFEQKRFHLVGLKFMQASEDLLKEHYIDLKDRPFFVGLVKYMHSGPVVAMVWEGLNVVKTGRVMLRETNPVDSKPGTIRGDFCIQIGTMANCEHTFIAIKPDGVQWGLVGEIIKRFEQKRFHLVGLKFMQASEDLLKEHYIDLKDRPFFVGLVKYMHSGPVVAMVGATGAHHHAWLIFCIFSRDGFFTVLARMCSFTLDRIDREPIRMEKVPDPSKCLKKQIPDTQIFRNC